LIDIKTPCPDFPPAIGVVEVEVVVEVSAVEALAVDLAEAAVVEEEVVVLEDQEDHLRSHLRI
jgi:hypothetical protein